MCLSHSLVHRELRLGAEAGFEPTNYDVETQVPQPLGYMPGLSIRVIL